MPDIEPKLATPNEVAEFMRTSTARLAQLRHRGEGPVFVRDGRRVLYRWSDIHSWVDEQLHVRTDRRVEPRGA